MPLDVPDGERCFLDANILYFCYVEVPPASEECRMLLQRVLNGDIVGYSNDRALSDCLHKVMLAEIGQLFGKPRERLIGWLKRNPDALAQLPKTTDVANRLPMLPLNLLPNDSNILPSAMALVQAHRLLLSDATVIASMQNHEISHLASNDDDFDRVPGITVWKPSRPSSPIAPIAPVA